MNLRHDLVVEVLELDVLVLEPSGSVVHRLTGEAADAARLLTAGVPSHALPERLGPALDALRSAGLLDEPADGGC